MKATMQMAVQRTLPALAVAACGALLLGVSSPVLAQKAPNANVSADALCTVAGTDVMVEAGLIQKDAPSSAPVVPQVSFSLEQHFPGNNKWQFVVGTSVTVAGPTEALALLEAGERYDDVANYDFMGVCNLVAAGANAVRAVVGITVGNANDKRAGSLVHTARCISFANPCRQP